MTKRRSISRREASKLMAMGSTSLLLNPLPGLQSTRMMNRRIIPSSNEEIPVIGLGTWQTFDVGVSDREREPLKEVLKVLIANGGSVIDSSPMYGRSEQVVGELTSELKLKEKVFEATKVWTRGEVEGVKQMTKSMDLLKVKQMDLMQIHNLVDWKTQLKTLRRWKEDQKIRYIGVTHYNEGGYGELEKIMKTEIIDFIQINYNLSVRAASDRILPIAKDKGIAVLINRPYQGGSLFRITKDLELPQWASEFDADTWGQFFLKFIHANPAVTCAIPGTSKAKHMLDNVKAGFGKLPIAAHQRKMIELISG